jgi:hypothetical protein
MSFIEDFKNFATRKASELLERARDRLPSGTPQFTLDTLEISLGGQSLAFRIDVERRAAWTIYVELSTRIATRPLDPEHGLLREALSSLYGTFALVRETLKDAGPAVARGRMSLGGFSLRLLNEELAPFLAKWHPKLSDWEHQPHDVGPAEHERNWTHASLLRQELEACRRIVVGYAESLAILAGLDEPEPGPEQ